MPDPIALVLTMKVTITKKYTHTHTHTTKKTNRYSNKLVLVNENKQNLDLHLQALVHLMP